MRRPYGGFRDQAEDGRGKKQSWSSGFKLLAGPEKSKLEDTDAAFHEKEYQRLRVELQAAHDKSNLPELPSEKTRVALNNLLVRVRLGGR